MSAEDAILQACLSFEKDPKDGIHERFPGYLVGALTDAGYRILAPGALDAETLERAAEVAEAYINVCESNGREFRGVTAAIRALKAEGQQ